ncbi:substrate-binding periplasmic protein [Roseateles sp. NT4]|uniref:substrate-binding periplasmic protein n=1 Tax=Roseateles sp. NT4 TaxID=3453715 RepID=UPI003EEE6BB4
MLTRRYLLGLMLLAAALPAAACELRVRWNPDPPYSMRDADGRLVGLQTEMTEQILQRLGCKAVWVELPWARALVELQAGRLDVLPGALRRPEREAYAYWVEQHVSVANRLFVRAGRAADLAGVTRLQQAWQPGFKLGVQIGVVYGADYAELLGNPAFRATLTQASARRNLWQMLEIGRVDGVLASEVTARWELGELGLAGRIVPTAVVITHEPAQTMFSRRSVDAGLVQRYREAAEALEKDGTQAGIVRKYLAD